MCDVVVNLITFFIEAVTICFVSHNISGLKIKKKSTLIFCSILFILCSLSYYFKFNNFIFLIVVIGLGIYIYLVCNRIYYSIIISVFTLLIFAIGDALAGFLLIFLFKIQYNTILYDNKTKILLVLIMLLVCFIISKFVRTFVIRIYNNNFYNIKKKNMVLISICLMIALISVYSYTMIIRKFFNSSNRIFVVLNLLLVGSVFVLIILITYSNNENIKKDLEQEYKEKELDKLHEYTEALEAVSCDLRNFKHDYLNILHAIGEYIQSGNMKEMKEFYENELMPESSKILVKDRCFMLLQYIKIPTLKGLISSKIITAQAKDIKTRIEIIEDINELSINLIDICRIIGILFDNAIEATEICDSKFIEFLVLKNENSVTFIISNSCSEDTPPIYKIYEKDFSTKGQGRGIGLKSVRDIISENYNNVLLNTKIEDSIFKQELIIIKQLN